MILVYPARRTGRGMFHVKSLPRVAGETAVITCGSISEVGHLRCAGRVRVRRIAQQPAAYGSAGVSEARTPRPEEVRSGTGGHSGPLRERKTVLQFAVGGSIDAPKRGENHATRRHDVAVYVAAG